MRTNEFLLKTTWVLALTLLLLSSHSFADDTNFVNASLASVNFQNLIGETLNETSDQPVRIGVLANRGSDIAMEEWGPTADYLSRILYPVEFEIVPLDFNDTVDAVQEKKVSFVCVNPSVYTNLEYHGLAQGIATLQVPGDPQSQAVFGGVIFTAADRDDIRDLSDLQGKSFVAVDPTSLGGWQAALLELRQDGIDPDCDFSSLNFTKTHDNAVMNVLSKTADAGTVRSTQIERMAKEGKINISDIKVLNDQKATYPEYPSLISTALYPEWPFAVVSGTNKELSKAVAIALLQMDTTDPAAKAVQGAGWAVPQDHSSVNELLKELHLPPYES